MFHNFRVVVVQPRCLYKKVKYFRGFFVSQGYNNFKKNMQTIHGRQIFFRGGVSHLGGGGEGVKFVDPIFNGQFKKNNNFKFFFQKNKK
jgi:hypothetical protein